MLAIWSLILLPFLNPAWQSGSSQFTHGWSLAWRILSITYFTGMWDECNCVVVWAFFGMHITLLHVYMYIIYSCVLPCSVQLSHVRLFVTPWITARQASLSITNSQSLLKLMSIQPSHPLSSPSLPAPNPSQHQGLFQWVSSSHEVPKYWNFNFSISPSNEHPGLIFFRMDWLVLLAVQGTLKSLLQHTHL